MIEEETKEIVVAQMRALPTTPMEMLALALERGSDLTVLEKLMDLQERHERSIAKKAFDAAIAEAKKEIKPVKKNREGNNNSYADQSAYAEAVDEILAKNGLSYRYRSQQDAASITVICVLSHRDGYSEETPLTAFADKTGSKNDIQALGSTLTYLQRYSLGLALGLSAAVDDDGKAAGGDVPISDDQRKAILDKIEESGADTEKFCVAMKVEAVPDIRAGQYTKAISMLEAKIKAAKKAAK